MVVLSLLGVLCLGVIVDSRGMCSREQNRRPVKELKDPNLKCGYVPNGNVEYEELPDVTCGTPVVGLTESLVIGGKAVTRGQWPWLVAIYKVTEGNLKFICGGNLISNIHVITAAHCIQDKNSQSKLEAKKGAVFLGRHNLDDYDEVYSIKRGIQKLIVHENWSTFGFEYDADIAIIIMDFSVLYSDYIRPLCVWEFSDNLNDVVGQQGALAGWGLNEDKKLNSECPKTIEVSIVNERTCLKSDPAISAASSENTFCAGGKNSEGPCQGDSGGGLVLKKDNKWYLRGLVSAAPSNAFGSCDTNKFVVFTDVGKFVSWIANNTIKNDSYF